MLTPAAHAMILEPLDLPGAYRLVPRRHVDERGYFMRTFCRDTFLARGLSDCSLQCSVSFNRVRGTLRGLHFQRAPFAETKLVRCSRGAAYDVIVDLRTGSCSFGRWHGEVLSSDEGCALYVPTGFAHGFITLEDRTEISYQMAEPYVPEAAAGLAWDDPTLAIAWPIEPVVMSAKDRALPRMVAVFGQAQGEAG